MSERSAYKPGEFCWVDLATSDVDAATGFYGELIGWQAEPAGSVEETGGYGFFLRNGKQAAGYGPLINGGHPAWSSYVKVADADEATAKIKAAGGTVMMEPLDLPNDSGRMAVCQDSEGAFFSVMQQKEHSGAELVNEIGSWTWNQLAARDIEAAKSFYGEVFGWSFEPSENAPPDAPYWMVQVSGQKWPEGMAGAMELGNQMPAETPPHWLVYFAVEDADAAAEQTSAAGGSVMAPPMDIAVGRMCVLTDPHGAAFAAIKPDYPEPR